MSSFLFGFQIFITVLLALVIVFQKSSGDGIIVSNTGGHLSSSAQTSFISKFTIFLVFIFMVNSLLLARYSINKYEGNKSIISSLENQPTFQEDNKKDSNVPKME